MRYLLLTLTVGCAAIEAGEGEELGVLAVELEACPAGQWCVESPAVLEAPLLHSVFAVDANDVFAVGDAGTILRRTDNEWRAMSSGTTKNLRGVWAASSSDVWAVGVEGTILRFDGTSWSAMSGATLDLDAVWGSSANDVWLAGSSRIMRWNGSTFRTFNLSGTLLTVHGTGPSDVWTTGENGFLFRFNGSFWSTVPNTGVTGTIFSVLAISITEAWIATPIPSKETVRFASGKWAPKTTNHAFFQGLAALAPNSIWGAGLAKVGHWNGLSWTTEQPFGSTAILFSVTTTPGHVWVVGEDSLIGHYAL